MVKVDGGMMTIMPDISVPGLTHNGSHKELLQASLAHQLFEQGPDMTVFPGLNSKTTSRLSRRGAHATPTRSPRSRSVFSKPCGQFAPLVQLLTCEIEMQCKKGSEGFALRP